MNKLILIPVFVFVFLMLYFRKESFQTVEESRRESHDNFYRPSGYTSEVTKSQKNNDHLTKTDFENMFSVLLKSINVNGPPGGANTSYDQNKFDLIFKDILVNSEKRNTDKYPNPNEYSVKLNINLNKIYKAE